MTQLTDRGAPVIPPATAGRPATPPERCDRAVTELAGTAPGWAGRSAWSLLPLLDECRRRTREQAAAWVAAADAAKRLPPASPAAGEDWNTAILPSLRYLRLLRRSLDDIVRDGRPTPPGRPRTGPGGRVVVPALPVDRYDRLTLPGFAAEVWMRQGLSLPEVLDRQAAAYRRPTSGGVSLVLGAGNVASIPVLDALDRLFVHRHVVLLKMNPVNDYAGEFIENALRPLIDRGVLRLVYGGADVGGQLVRHPAVTDVHITGSDKSFTAIVFGGGEEGAARRARGEPLVDKPVTGELGNVTPVIVVPGPWRDSDFGYQGEHVASMLANNGGFNCIAVRVLVTHAGWAGRPRFVEAVRAALRATPRRYAYYPGAADRYRAFVDAHPEAEPLGVAAEGELPWTLISGVDSAAAQDICFTTESFNSVFAETPLPAGSPAEFVRAAVRFVNDRVWGSLGVTVLVHPRSMRDPAVATAVREAEAELRYGTVAVNQWSGLNFAFGSTTWGAYPGHPLTDVQSGVGVVHNSLMLDGVEKTVLRGPFRVWPKPYWFPSTRGAGETARRAALLYGDPGWRGLPGLFASALRG